MFYMYLIPLASNGYGYMGYRGYHHGHSYWYWGGPNTYYNRNVRSGSVSGANVRGGGPGSKRPAPALEPKIDLDRLVWDPEYRDEIRHRLNRHA